jgi:hypothetical protein
VHFPAALGYFSIMPYKDFDTYFSLPYKDFGASLGINQTLPIMIAPTALPFTQIACACLAFISPSRKASSSVTQSNDTASGLPA